MKHETFKGRLLRSSILAGAAVSMAATATPAFAQDDEVDEIFITGSRIARPDLTSNSPVTIVDSEALELSGAINVEQMLHTLPQVIPGLNASSNNPSAQQGPGQVTIDLRGLGASRSLILVNGRRFTPSGNLGLVDINNIPGALIDRIDVVTGGTSAVYGSDAIAGVVNFILKDDFEGVQFGTQVGISGEGDASQYTMNVTMGGNFDRGNAVLYASYFNREALTAADRDWSKNTFVGSSGVPQGRIGGLDFAFDGSGALSPFVSCFPGWPGDPCDVADAYQNGDTDRYNYAPPNNTILPQDRIVIEGFMSYDINDNVEFFADLAYINSRTSQTLAPTPVFGGELSYDHLLAIVPGIATDPLNPGWLPGDTLSFNRRMTEVGPRVGELFQNTVNITAGFKGDIPWIDGWQYEVYYQYGRNEGQTQSFNNVSLARLNDALSGCTAYNLPGCTADFNFFGPDLLTAEQGEFLAVNLGELQTFERQTVSAVVTGDLYELPHGPLAAAIGFEYRKDNSSDQVDYHQIIGDIQGFNQSNSVFGSMDVAEVYVEAIAPLFPNFELEAGYRYSQYSSVGSVNTWKVGASWQPVDDIRFRTTYNEATRAPNIFELFRAGDQNFPGYQDPCNASAAPDAATIALCTTLMAPFVYNPATFAQSNSQTEAHEFGNPDLSPETATSLTIGAVIQPRWIDNLTVTVDWYDIELEDYITSRSVNEILAGCFDQADPLHSDCVRISRDPLTGSVNDADTTLGNIGLFELAGVDVQATYDWAWADTRWFSGLPGDMTVKALYTFVDEYAFNGSDGIGDILSSSIIPEHKGSVRMTYAVNDWQFSWNIDYNDEMYDSYFEINHDAVYYHDATVRWFPNDTYEATLVVGNLTDEQPPMTISSAAASWGQNNTVPAYWDPLGRYYRFGLKAKF